MLLRNRSWASLLTGLLLAATWLAWPNPAAADTVFRVITVNGYLRGYYLRLPPQYDPKVPVPLVMMFHGYGSDGARCEGNTGFSEVADREGFIIVYPNALGDPKAWSIPWIPRQKGDPEDDLAFISALYTRLTTNYNIDPARVYAGGISSGANMAYFVGSRLSDRFAAIGVVGGAIGTTVYGDYAELPFPEYPVSMVIFHGLQDTIVPYWGGVGKYWPAIDWVSVTYSTLYWVLRNGCFILPDTYVTPDVLINVFRWGLYGTEVALYTAVNGDHSWQLLGEQMSTSEEMWAFFATHPKW